MLKVKNDYEAFCLDEVAVYMYMKWQAGEKTYKEKIVEQNKAFLKIINSKVGKC